MQGIQSTIDAILINNPLAVSAQLAALGLVEEGSILSPDEIKLLLYDTASRLSDEEGNQLVITALDVPIDLEGENAEALLQHHITHGNRIAMISEINACTDVAHPLSSIKTGYRFGKLPFGNIMVGIGMVFMIVLTIVLIKKI